MERIEPRPMTMLPQVLCKCVRTIYRDGEDHQHHDTKQQITHALSFPLFGAGDGAGDGAVPLGGTSGSAGAMTLGLERKSSPGGGS